MKATVKILFVFLIVSAFGFVSKNNLDNVSSFSEIEYGITIPENVKAIIDRKCMGCHKPDSRNSKAKEKLQWAQLTKMTKEEQKHFVDEMFEVLEEGKMPPKKALERRPQMKLTDSETKTLLAWVEAEEKRLKGN